MKLGKPSKLPLRKALKSKTKEQIRAAEHFIESLLRYRKLCKQYDTYVRGVRKAIALNEEDRVYFTFNFDTVVTGRLSCSSYKLGSQKLSKGVSFHTLPRSSEDTVNIRKLFIPEPGYVFVTVDYSAAELRVIAHCSGDENMLKAFKEGLDFHRHTASLVFDKQYDAVTPEERQIAKTVNFLIVYGGGVYNLAEQLNKPVDYCKKIFSHYQNSYPDMFRWMEDEKRNAHDRLYSVSPLGRRRNLPNLKSPSKKYVAKAERQAVNSIIQSFASDFTLFGLVRVNKMIKKLGLDARILATVHDSIEIQCKISDVRELCEGLNYILPKSDFLMEKFKFTLKVPMSVDIEVGNSFGDGINAEFSDNGRLLNFDTLYEFTKNNSTNRLTS